MGAFAPWHPLPPHVQEFQQLSDESSLGRMAMQVYSDGREEPAALPTQTSQWALLTTFISIIC
jgi:hypothetical protein